MKKIKIPEGFRELRDGENRQTNDLVWEMGSGPFRIIPHSHVGQPYRDNEWMVIRRLRAPKKVTIKKDRFVVINQDDGGVETFSGLKGVREFFENEVACDNYDADELTRAYVVYETVKQIKFDAQAREGVDIHFTS